ncbi:glycosyltransferase family 2 protein [Petrimonas sp.]|uniref:glycosyltransferase family 2 protein n=1 Tax=Petrimonas sp. TaxID=2023866 RepID=UPI003F51A99C
MFVLNFDFVPVLYGNVVDIVSISLSIILFAALSVNGVLAYLAIRRNHFVNKFSPVQAVSIMKNAPGISIITGAYNESATIIENVHSLLSLNYQKYELIVVNDGSKDDTLDKMIAEFGLVEATYIFDQIIPCEPIKKIYRSEFLAYKNLIVIDKFNGGSKADAINAGLNLAKYDYYLNIDVDCILDFDTLLLMIEKLLNSKERCIAVGATLRMSNSSFVKRGTLEEIIVPGNLFVRFQELEYIRSFVLGKMAWAHINAMSNISGGLGLFDKDIVIKVGGYDKKSLGEDMDLIFKITNYMLEHKLDYRLYSIAKALCFTEGPDSLKVLIRQRKRWSRGLFQILKKNRRVLFNPKYKKMGFIVYPYNLFFEFLSPIVEGIGYFIMGYFLFTNITIFAHLLVVVLAVISFYIAMSFYAVFLDRIVYNYYNKWHKALGIAFMAFLEPILYHPVIVYSALRGYLDELTGKKKKWGDMPRKGFNNKK